MTSSTNTVEILKSAILLEKKGKAFYGQVANQASHPEVKRFFELMADEETQHIKILTEQFKSYRDTERFTPMDTPHTADNIADKVLTRTWWTPSRRPIMKRPPFQPPWRWRKKPSASMPTVPRRLKTRRKKHSMTGSADGSSPTLSFLSDIDREITERIWHDNNFWAF